jgi:glycosyltransferase involved in cell wall biosynthesis
VSTLVSVVMPAWRPRPDWLHEAVRSALDEHACDVELIVVDDGNEQPVAELLADVADPRLRVMRIEHAGPYAARNAALATVRGEFVRYVDADDVVEPGSTGRLLELARRSGGEVLTYGATMMCDEALVPRRAVTAASEGDVVEECLLGGFDVYVVSILYPRAVLERAGRWEETAFAVSGDWDYVLRVLEQAPVRRLDEVVTLYRRHPTSITKSARVAAGADAGRLVLERYFERHPEQRGSALERHAYTNLHILRARSHAVAGERRLALRQLARAARRDPPAALALVARHELERLRDLSARARRHARRAPRSRA